MDKSFTFASNRLKCFKNRKSRMTISNKLHYTMKKTFINKVNKDKNAYNIQYV